MFDPENPATLPELRAALTRLVAEGGEYLATLPSATFFAPQGHRWSPAEQVRHLRKSTAPVAEALRLPAPLLHARFGRGAATSRDFLTLRDAYRGLLAEGGQAGRFAPSPEPAPSDPSARRAEIMSAWLQATGDLDAAAAHWSEDSLEQAWLPHPLLGLLTVREMLAFTVYHTSHHLTQIAARVNQATP